MDPRQIISQPNAKAIESFRTTETKCCYHCDHLEYRHRQWVCSRHGILFGYDGKGIANTAEFTCADWASWASASIPE